MKKISLIFVLSFISSAASFAQAPPGKGGKQLNAGLGFSGWGIPVYVGADFGIHQDITIGPRVTFRNYSDFDRNLLTFGFNGNYHFNTLFNMPSEWNFYAGLTMNYYAWSGSDVPGRPRSRLYLDAQIGGRYFFSDKFGVNLEFGGGAGTGGGIFGITVKL